MIQVIVALAVLYGLVVVGGRLAHRHFVYKPDHSYVRPADVDLADAGLTAADLAGVEEVKLKAPDGVTLIAWYAAADAGKPTIVFFTGNGGSTATHADKFAEIHRHGYGLLMLNYRGYGGSEGKPTEADNVADAGLAYDALRGRGIAPEDIVIYGESIGTSVATQLAAKRSARALVLEAPFTNIVDVARKTWWFLPLNFVLVDQYRTIDVIGRVHMPLFVVHGSKDSVIDISLGEKLFAAANDPKRMEIFPEADHNDLFEYGAFDAVDRFLSGLMGEQARRAETPVAAKAAG